MSVPSHRITSTHNTRIRERVAVIVKESNAQYRCETYISRDACYFVKCCKKDIPFLADPEAA